MFNKLKTMLEKFFGKNKEEDMSEVNLAAEPVSVVQPVALVAKTGVSDLDKALAYIEHGIKVLGEDAKDELVALAKKYL